MIHRKGLLDDLLYQFNMSNSTVTALGSVQKTLLLPLWGRAVETAKPRPLLVDPTAAAIVGALDYDFAGMARNLSRITRLAWIARSLHMDRAVRAFLVRHPEATIVNLGCGLDTSFERVDNGRLRWFDLDLPDVIALRLRFIPERQRRRVISASLLDTSWWPQVRGEDGILFLAAGVLYYLREDEVRTLLTGLAQAFPGAEMIFDGCSPLGMRAANKKVIQAGGMDKSAELRWGLERVRDLEKWDPRIAVLASHRMFRGMWHGLSPGELAGTLLADALHIMFMVQLRLGERR